VVDLQVPDSLLKQAAAVHRHAVEICAEELERELAPWIKLNARPEPGGRFDADTFQGDLSAYLRRVKKRFADGALDKALASVAKAADQNSFDKLQRIPGIDASKLITGGRAAIARFRDVNARLISSVPLAMAVDVGRTLGAPDVRDLHVSGVTKLLEQRFGVAQSKAEFWGRDQTLKLYANVNRERQIAAGARRYEWGHSDDERVRGRPDGLWPHGGDHWSLGGHIFEWSAPPIVHPRTGKRANPGEDYECRCTAYPVFDDNEGDAPAPPSFPEVEEEAETLASLQPAPLVAPKPRPVRVAVPADLTPEQIAAKQARTTIPSEEVDDAKARYLQAQEVVFQQMKDHPEVASVESYTGPDYLNINAMLRGETVFVETQAAKDRLVRTSSSLQAFLTASPKFVGTVERGLLLSDSQLAEYVPGGVVTFRAFASTSVLGDMARVFAEGEIVPGKRPVLLRIRQKSGVAVNRLSVNAGEAEVLLPAGTRVRVLSVETSADDISIVHLEEV
jgi:SPP1 gp7 family putative phage head morphogenesis protein